MISNTRQAIKAFQELPVETFLIAVDDKDREYIIDGIVKRKLHSDDNNEWCYALKIKTCNDGCIKR